MKNGRTAGLAPRFAAWRILHDVRHGVPFDTALKRSIKDLEPDDKRLAHELAAGVFRSRTELDRALAGAVDRGLESVRADMLDVLRLGAFQLLRLDKVPPHAAVQTTVGVARRLGGRRVGGFINAVLRKIGSSTHPRDQAAGSLADRHSHPEWLVARWLERIGPEATEARLAANNRRPPLVIQPNGMPLDQLERLLIEAGVGFRHAPWEAGLVVDVTRPTEIPGFLSGAFFVQDPAQQMVVRFLAPDPGSLVYDACAAPGGKAIAAAGRARLVVAADRHRGRVQRVAQNLDRLAISNVSPLVADATMPPVRTVGAVTLDVPCLGTGTLARNPDARWRVTPEALETLAAQARSFLDVAAEVIESGGLLLFATCSLEPEENELQIAQFLSRDQRFVRERVSTVPAELLTPEGDLLARPEIHGTDGAYAARLRKTSR